MQVTLNGEFLHAEPTKSGKGHMVTILQTKGSCDLYAPNEGGFQWPSRMSPVVIEAVVRPGYEGRGFQATVQSIRVAGSKNEAKAGVSG
jgi:hypothetical protein